MVMRIGHTDVTPVRLTRAKGCPFCGRRDLAVMEVDGFVHMRCDFCGAMGPQSDPQENPLPYWNRRKVPK